MEHLGTNNGAWQRMYWSGLYLMFNPMPAILSKKGCIIIAQSTINHHSIS